MSVHADAAPTTVPNPAHELGEVLWALLLTRYPAEEARDFVQALTEPLRPTDPKRSQQDRALTTITNRLFKAAGDGAAA